MTATDRQAELYRAWLAAGGTASSWVEAQRRMRILARRPVVTAAVPLIAEVLNLAITEHWHEIGQLRGHSVWAAESRHVGQDDFAARREESYSAGVEALAVALHARLQEQGTLP